MTLEDTFKMLRDSVDSSHQKFEDLHRLASDFLVQDGQEQAPKAQRHEGHHPAKGVTDFIQDISDVLGETCRALELSEEALTAARMQKIDATCKVLIAVHEQVQAGMEKPYAEKISSHARLINLGDRLGRRYDDWFRVVRNSLDPCTFALQAVDGAVCAAWKDLSERLSAAKPPPVINPPAPVSSAVPEGMFF